MSQYLKGHKELEGKRFGKWTVIKYLRTDNKNAIFLCECDCGTIRERKKRSILHDNSLSCGCAKWEMVKDKKKAISSLDRGRRYSHEKYYKNGTSKIALKQKLSKNSTTGVKGVSYIPTTKRYRAYIFFKGKQHHLGVYDTLEEAAFARKEGEKEYFGKFLDEIKSEA